MAREQQQPMSDAWLAFVLEQIATIPPERDHTSVPVSDLQLLLAEVERLRAREAALVEVVERMASGPHWAIDLYTLQQQARALLAEEG